MSSSLTDLGMVYRAQTAESRRNENASLKALAQGLRTEPLLYRALGLGQQVHVEKLRMLLQSMKADVPTEDMDGEHRARVMDDLSAMVMTAAKERQPLAESLLIQIMKAAMSHDSLSRRGGTLASSYHVCQVCGYIASDAPPERCPVCRAQAAQFDAVE